MPVTKSRTGFYDIGLDQANTTGFLFGDDDSAPEAKLYTQSNTDDNFPTLVRREPNMVRICSESNSYSHICPCILLKPVAAEGSIEDSDDEVCNLRLFSGFDCFIAHRIFHCSVLKISPVAHYLLPIVGLPIIRALTVPLLLFPLIFNPSSFDPLHPTSLLSIHPAPRLSSPEFSATSASKRVAKQRPCAYQFPIS